MRKLVPLAVAIVLIIGFSVPASAATWIQLRYWWANGKSYESGNTWDSGLYGIGLRRDFMNGMWALSLNYDRGNINNWTGGSIGTTGTNQFFNINVHRQWPLQNNRGWVSAFVGYTNASWDGPAFPTYVHFSGIWVGGDARFNISGNWWLTGSVGYAPRQGASQLNFNLGGTVNNIPTYLLEYKVGLGYNFNPTWGLEAGYRWDDLRYDPTIMCGGNTNCGLNWSGAYVGINFTAP